MNSMKIIHLISGGDVGGAKTHVLSLLRGLGQTQQVLLVCFMQGPFAQEAQELGIPTLIMEEGSILSVCNRLAALIRKEQYQIIHCHGARANMLGAILRHRVHTPVVTTVHSDYRLDYLGRPLHRLTYGTINTVALRLLNYHISVSEAMGDMLIARGFHPQRLFSIYNGIDFSRVTPQMERSAYLQSIGVRMEADTVVFGIAARFHPVKDLSTLLRGFAAAVAQCPSIRLVIAGDGEQAALLKGLAETLCPPNTVTFAGWVSDMDSFYNALDVNTLTSLSETFPYALTEGIRLHCATISTRVGGIPALIDHGVSGLLFEPGDDHALAQHMITLATDTALRSSMAQRLYHKASTQFSFAATVERQLQIYRTILRRQQRPKKQRDGVLICGAYGKGNAGDDAILEAIISQMQDLDPDLPLYVLSRTPKQTMQRYRIEACHTFDLLKILRIMRKTRLYLSGGGTLIQDVTSTRSLQYYLSSIVLAKRCGNRVLMYGCGIGPVNRPSNRRHTQAVINRFVDSICLRENHSIQELEALGVTQPPRVLAADPALLLPPAGDEQVDSFLLSNQIQPQGQYILFALRPWEGFSKAAPALIDCIQHAHADLGLTPILFAVEPERDLPSLQQISRQLSCPHHILSSPAGGAMTIGVLARMQAVVSMRLHALIFAAATGVPLVGIVYDPKVSAFLDYLEQPRYVALSAVTSETLKQHIAAALAQGQNAAARRAALAQFRERAQQSRETARALLED